MPLTQLQLKQCINTVSETRLSLPAASCARTHGVSSAKGGGGTANCLVPQTQSTLTLQLSGDRLCVDFGNGGVAAVEGIQI